MNGVAGAKRGKLTMTTAQESLKRFARPVSACRKKIKNYYLISETFKIITLFSSTATTSETSF